jgi:hypothetical protein
MRDGKARAQMLYNFESEEELNYKSMSGGD